MNSINLSVFAGAALLPLIMQPALAQSDYYPPPSGEFYGEGPWRSQAPWHYHSGTCCYCLEATAARKTDNPEVTEYFVKDTWYALPNSSIMMPEAGKPLVNFYMICDPLKQKYACVIPGAAF